MPAAAPAGLIIGTVSSGMIVPSELAHQKEDPMPLQAYLAQSIQVLELAGRTWNEESVAGAVESITSALRSGKPLLVCGNGGSAADAMHITGELVGRFLPVLEPFDSHRMGKRLQLRDGFLAASGGIWRAGRRPVGHQHFGKLEKCGRGFPAGALAGHDDDSAYRRRWRRACRLERLSLRRAFALHAFDPTGPHLPLPLLVPDSRAEDRGNTLQRRIAGELS
jgi:hypothetical protein